MAFSDRYTREEKEKLMAGISERIAGRFSAWEEGFRTDGRVQGRMYGTAMIIHALRASGMEVAEISSRLNMHEDVISFYIEHWERCNVGDEC